MEIINPSLAEMRNIARQSLPPRAFLRRDRGKFLWVSNAPAFDAAIDALPGFIIVREKQLMYLLPDASWIAQWEAQLPPDFFSEALLRFRDTEADMANLQLVAEGLKLLEANACSVETAPFMQKLRQRAALALRGGCSGGALYACALIAAQLKNNMEETEP